MKKFANFTNLCYNSKQLYEKGEFCHKDQGVKFMRKALFTGALITLLCVPSVAFAKGTAGIKFEGNNNVNVGDEFTVNMVIDNVSDTEESGIVGLGGYITYDKDVLELVDIYQGDAYEVQINRNNNKFIGIDYTMANGIKSRTNVFGLTFRSKAAGNTNITLTEGELEDQFSSVEFNVQGLNVTSNEVVENTPVVEENLIVNEEKITEKAVEIVENNTNYETQEVVDTTTIENKEETPVVKTTKKAKKATKKTTKSKKSENGLVSFFKNLFGLIIKKTTE